MPDLNNVDPALVDSITKAAEDFPYQVKIVSGYREGDPRFHGQGKAIDVQLIDPETNKAIPNYQSPENFRTYEQFAQKVREVQQQDHPELSDKLRWGGYFPGKTNYGAVDLMHFDTGGDKIAMGGGTWEGGLSKGQRNLLPEAQSVGMADAGALINKQASDPNAQAPDKSSYQQAQEKQIAANIPAASLINLVHNYNNGTMPPDAKAALEKDVADGHVMLPPGVTLGGQSTKPTEGAKELPQAVIDNYNAAAADPYNKTLMPTDARQALDNDLKNGFVKLPSGAVLNQVYPTTVDKMIESVTGSKRASPQTNALPNYDKMPEENNPSMAGVKTAVGSTLSFDPTEITKIIKTNFPDVQVSQDNRGNYILKSAINGQSYAIKPGMDLSDVVKMLGVGAAFLPAGGATTVVGAGLANAGTQAGLEVAKAAAGGNAPSVKDIGVAGAIGAAIPAGGAILDAVRGGKAAAEAGAAPTATASAPTGGAANPEAVAATEAAGKGAAPAAAPPAQAAAAAPAAKDAVAAAQPEATAAADAAVAKAATPAATNTAEAIARRTAISEARANAVASSPEVAASKQSLEAITAKHGATSDAAAAAKADHENLVSSVADSAAKHDAPTVAPLTDSALVSTAKEAAAGGKAAVDTLAEQAAPDAERVAAAKRLGVEDYLQPDHTSTNQSFRDLAQAAKTTVGSPGRKAEIEGLTQVAQKANNLIDTIGGSSDLSTISADLKSQMSTTQKALDQKAETLYGQLRASIPAKAEAAANNVLSFIKQRADELGGPENLSPMEKTILKKLSPQVSKDDVATQIANKYKAGEKMTREDAKAYLDAMKNKSTVATAKQPTYALLDDVRKDVGNALYKRAGVFKDEDSGLLKKLYSGLSKDQAAVAEAHGMGNTFKLAKATVGMRKGLEDDISSLFGKNIDGSIVTKLGTAVTAAAKGDATKLVNMLKSIPENMRQSVVASGLVTAFGKNFRNGNINFTTFTHWYEGLAQNKQAYNAVMANLPQEARAQLADLYQVSKGISLASKEKVATGRLATLSAQLQEENSNLLTRLYQQAGPIAKGLAKGVIADAVGGHGAGIGMAFLSALKGASAKPNALKAVDALISSPEFKQATQDIASGAKATAVPKIAYSKPFIRVVRALGNPREMSDKEKWINEALQTSNNKGN